MDLSQLFIWFSDISFDFVSFIVKDFPIYSCDIMDTLTFHVAKSFFNAFWLTKPIEINLMRFLMIIFVMNYLPSTAFYRVYLFSYSFLKWRIPQEQAEHPKNTPWSCHKMPNKDWALHKPHQHRLISSRLLWTGFWPNLPVFYRKNAETPGFENFRLTGMKF